MQGDTAAMEMPPPLPPSPPTSPGVRYKHQQRPSVTSVAMFRSKRHSSRATDGVTSRSSDEDSRIAVKVAVRVRPPLKPSDPGYDLIPPRFRESTCEEPTPTSLSVQSPQGKKLFVFDRVFGEDTDQEGVWEYLSESVTSFVKGYNVSILAYGQSGSGKSYTMGTSGPEDQNDPKIMGIVPRAAQALFDKLNGTSQPKSALQTPKRYSTQTLTTLGSLAKAATAAADKNWTLKATYVEIYQEHLRDLLVPESVPQQDRAAVAIREDTKGRILVTGLTQVTINSIDDLLNALNSGSAIRQTDATNINARSSRSHAVFSLNLIQKKSDAPTQKHERRMSMPVEGLSGAESLVTLDSKLHFVDLAGSERLKNTGSTGDRAKEGISINGGLASLGKVISQLSSKHGHAHISYRDSKLTRLLQDSLGGNAITFMVACVTPAIFHLSETLNTVHYAQRARAIQSKPEIQQSREESDKQAAIDRLRAEVSFLRDQIRHSEHAETNGLDVRGRSDRVRGQEAELHSQLMDMQENYNALSNRHAKLITELSKARDGDPETLLLNEDIASNATERIKRSNSFAEAVEQIILEYEKTIKTLESSLSKTRSSLSGAESTLQVKETRIAYMETVQQQLQTRIQKAMDREQNNESYLRDLETRIEGSTTGEEKSTTLIAELRKELSRARESEDSAEDYISTLEERLAEAEQDQEMMHREIERLEHVVERQRSIGRLDNLLGELDSVHRAEPGGPNGVHPTINGHHDNDDPFINGSRSISSAAATRDEDFDSAESDYVAARDSAHDIEYHRSATENTLAAPRTVNVSHSSAQDDFMADKVENLTQELFDLQSDHESVITDYHKLQQKYQTALETLAKLEYDKEAQKMGDVPAGGKMSYFLADAGTREVDNADAEGQPLSSRSLSAELSSQEQYSSLLADPTENMGTKRLPRTRGIPDEEDEIDPTQVALPDDDEDGIPELEMLRRRNAENETSIAELSSHYRSLHTHHEATLAQIEDLKQEVAKAQSFRPSSPSFNSKMSYFQRQSNDLMSSHADRASKSVAWLKNMAQEKFEQSPDQRQSFQANINTVVAELHLRSERLQSLEADLAATKKEMEAKQTIITGLTRERANLKASSGVDFTVVSQMREQLLQGETQIRSLQEQHVAKEKDLQNQLEGLKARLDSQGTQLPTPIEERSLTMPGGFAATPATELSDRQAVSGAPEGNEEQPSTERGIVGDLQAKHQGIIDTLQRQVDEYKATANSHAAKLGQLEEAHGTILRQVEEDSRSRDLSSRELQTHKDLVANLENQLQMHKSAITIHQETLESLQASHSKELEDLKTSMTTLDQQAAEHSAATDAEHSQTTRDLQSKLTAAQDEKTELLRNASSALGYSTEPSKIHQHIRGLVDEGKEVHSRHLKATNDLKSVQEELQNSVNKNVDMESKIAELKEINEETIKSLEKATERERKSSRLVEELEEQLNNNYDSHQATNSRLSVMQDEVAAKRIELEQELESQKLRSQALEQQIEALHRHSTMSNGSANREMSPDIALGRNGSGSSMQPRKQTLSPTLLTPPPSIPLPPLPNSPTSSSPQIPNDIDGRGHSPPLQRTTSPSPNNASPPGSRNASPEVSHQLEESESRIRTIEKHLFAEKQLTATLEEALVDLETSANRTKLDMDNYRKKCSALEEELYNLKMERTNSRASLQQVEEEREMRVHAEKARQALEERMSQLNSNKRKKRSALSGMNCF